LIASVACPESLSAEGVVERAENCAGTKAIFMTVPVNTAADIPAARHGDPGPPLPAGGGPVQALG